MKKTAQRWILALVLLPLGAWAQVAQAEPEYRGADRLEEWSGKRILVLSPHPDDDVLTSGGTIALLTKAGNDVHVVVYTNGNAGSRDPSMTLERLAAIRAEEERLAMATLGVSSERIRFLGHDDGMLEYVDRRALTRRIARAIRRVRPHAVFAPDPGAPFEQYHKSDHRSAAMITVDAIRAARWRLYFPELEQAELEEAGVAAWDVPLTLFYYSAQPNYTVDVTATGALKAKAAAAHVSQFGAMVDRYDPAGVEQARKKLEEQFLKRFRGDEGRFEERFRRSTAY